jgi:Na+-transporting NADH:ubiquinone oxidoreductase subunit NqrC
MKRTKLLINACIASVVIFVTSVTTEGQQEEKPSLDKGNIESQFKYVIDESSNYMEYKVIKRYWMNKLKSHVLDTINLLHAHINDNNRVIAQKSRKIDSLQLDLVKTNDNLILAVKERDSIKLLGIKTDKRVYNSIISVFTAVLLFSILILFLMYKRSHKVTTETRTSLAETREEFEAHRKWALAREQKLMRELHDEKMKNKVRQS